MKQLSSPNRQSTNHLMSDQKSLLTSTKRQISAQNLPPKYKTVYHLNYFDNKSQEWLI